MYNKLRDYMERLFENEPKTVKMMELKEEMLQNLVDKYNDLINQGKTEEAAYNIAVASVGDISELTAELKKENASRSVSTKDAPGVRSAALVSVAVMLYITSVIPVIFLSDNIAGVCVMFSMIALATGLIIFNGMTKPKYTKVDETIVEEFKEWKNASSSSNAAKKSVMASIWLVTVTVYLLVSFFTMAWHITWIIFLITAAVNGIVNALFDLKK